jgi:hypothetical protein
MSEDKTNNWAAFGGEYIKALDVLSDTDEYVIVGVSSKHENGKDVLHLEIERDGVKKLFGCNKTNAYAVQQACPQSPKDAIGKVITFGKVRVAKPGTDEMVDGLRLKFKDSPEPSEVDTDDAGVDEEGSL